MSTLSVLYRSKDSRVITPAEIAADPGANTGSPDLTAREFLADAVSGQLVSLYGGREPWRQQYSEVLVDGENGRPPEWINPSRWPVEGCPSVVLGGATFGAGSFRVAGQCRHLLRRTPTSELVSASLPIGQGLYSLPSYFAGYVPPGSVNAGWVAATAYGVDQSTAYGDLLGSWLKIVTSNLLWECTVAGTSHASVEPTWVTSLSEWSPGFTHSATQWLSPANSLLYFEPTTPGTSGTEAPTWPTVAGATVAAVGGTAVYTARAAVEIVDGTATWTGRPAKEFPWPIRKAALVLARMLRSIDQDGECKKHEEKAMAVKALLKGAC